MLGGVNNPAFPGMERPAYYNDQGQLDEHHPVYLQQEREVKEQLEATAHLLELRQVTITLPGWPEIELNLPRPWTPSVSGENWPTDLKRALHAFANAQALPSTDQLTTLQNWLQFCSVYVGVEKLRVFFHNQRQKRFVLLGVVSS